MILFPLNIWLLEIIEGYIIMFLFGKNIAWEYRGHDAFCHGNIKLGYAAPWIALGLVVELAWHPMILPLATELATSGMTGPVLALAALVTLRYSPRMGLRGVWSSLQGTGESDSKQD